MRYVCHDCNDGGCELRIDMMPIIHPRGCPFLLGGAQAEWVAPDVEAIEPCKWCGYPKGYWAKKRTVHCMHR